MKAKKDYDDAKRCVIDEDLLPQYRHARKQSFYGYDPSFIEAFKQEVGEEVFHACQLLYNSSLRKYLRCRNKLWKAIQSGKAYFLTLTFTDGVLEKTTQKTRRTYVSRWLKKVSIRYVGNIDFGDRNGREHYHALVEAECPPPKSWKYGFMDRPRKVGNTEADRDKISKYTTKLTRHALKESTKGDKVKFPRLIVSRIAY